MCFNNDVVSNFPELRGIVYSVRYYTVTRVSQSIIHEREL